MNTQYLIDSCTRSTKIIKNYFKFRNFLTFHEHYSVYIETDKYILKTANYQIELFKMLLLRYRTFLSRAATLKSFGIDLDDFDYTCDHIIVIDKKTKKICGTYRLRASTYTDQYYTQSEFNLGDFPKELGVKLELGRACTDINHRNGVVINLLWRGIAQYAQKCNARYLFGCSSIKTLDAEVAKSYYQYFEKKNLLGSKFQISPLDSFKGINHTTQAAKNIDITLPPLLRTYLAGGAKVYGEPAFDYTFKCIDFITIMDLQNLKPSFKRKFFK